ncbi:hypothetical protein BN439_2814 [Erwinia amylovora Ea644]|uniref:Uncharacterized protein n=3 Tax=Erwinia amylovora TaxID=552 RepID=A0A831A3F9_ERWAM|nr:hypothetical protein EaACW_2457 [Erwinia amylovora ACW56400]QJQ53865.1 hypothetical protein EHX00_1158 [Erwinia amylovora]CBA21726.1 hypothetical protein predicted by Glimmer/Critica [Erwinia amylovora CFBP1430]CBX81322.1 hypothetical protein predicted by Glimmer/Critica [Erwinia amylovora ATCC BAA-2158]CCO79303.1 hypothetical protein BN432_2516 [Erwinia amylovora Ea356]CCO83108.1 hypothetical protein BN433_2548 [Erwinia amylovora Ea266]CCO86870.1 hypothetical protein BN434_2492 [Erwinia a
MASLSERFNPNSVNQNACARHGRVIKVRERARFSCLRACFVTQVAKHGLWLLLKCAL